MSFAASSISWSRSAFRLTISGTVAAAYKGFSMPFGLLSAMRKAASPISFANCPDITCAIRSSSPVV